MKPHLSTDLSIEIVDSEAGFHALRGEWNELAEALPDRSVFLRHEWFDAAWEWIKTGATLHLICGRLGGELVAISPFVVRIDHASRVRARYAEFLTVPDTQLCDMICRETQVAIFCAAVAKHLCEEWRGWDVLRLNYLPAHSLTLSPLRRALAACGLVACCDKYDLNRQIKLVGGWATYYANRSRSLKKSNNLVANRIRAAYRPDVHWERGVPATGLAPLVAELAELSAASWKRLTGNSLDQPGPHAFIRRLTEHAAREGWLSVWRLTLDGRPAAMEYQLIYDRQVHALRADFKDEYKEVSPGSYLNTKMLEVLFGADLACYFMGPGSNAYKARWSDEAEELLAMVTYNRTMRGRLQQFADQVLRPAWRALRQRIRSAESSPAGEGPLA